MLPSVNAAAGGPADRTGVGKTPVYTGVWNQSSAAASSPGNSTLVKPKREKSRTRIG